MVLPGDAYKRGTVAGAVFLSAGDAPERSATTCAFYLVICVASKWSTALRATFLAVCNTSMQSTTACTSFTAVALVFFSATGNTSNWVSTTTRTFFLAAGTWGNTAVNKTAAAKLRQTGVGFAKSRTAQSVSLLTIF